MHGHNENRHGHDGRSTRRQLRATLLAAAMTFGAMAAAMAEETGESGLPAYYERFAFEAADTDGDDLVSEAELARDAAAGFSGLDLDRNSQLTPEELGPHDPALFARVDQSGDGLLTFAEVIVHKINGLEAGDTNGDGHLSFEEMVAEAKSELGVE